MPATILTIAHASLQAALPHVPFAPSRKAARPRTGTGRLREPYDLTPKRLRRWT